jgi:GNAT superfamily N-acetyltransferase
MLTIRQYREGDAKQVGILIADTFHKFNLFELTTQQQEEMLGPFLYERSLDHSHQKAIAQAIRAPTVLVAVLESRIVGVLRGGRVDERGRTVLQSLFVRGNCHRQGIGRRLVERFEKEYTGRGVTVFKLLSTLHAVPFYQAMGYRKSTGMRFIHSFDGRGLPSQPMKKVVKKKRTKEAIGP